MYTNYYKDKKTFISILPEKPGIYQFFDSFNRIIYIGKASNLKRRVSSYFAKEHVNRKTRVLVRNIADIKYMVVETEQDALLLENSLIKKYRPRYNIRLKDDKSYPWICIKHESFPRILITRNFIRDGSIYFGPYTSLFMVRALIDLFKSEYKFRTCNYRLTKDNISANKFKVCLEYHIGNCYGPCQGLISENEYNKGIDEIINILKGNVSGVIKHLKNRMERKSKEMKFEDAQNIKNKIESLSRYQSKSTVVSPQITDVDVFSIDQDDKFAYINYLKVIEGAIVQTYTLEIKKVMNEAVEDILLAGIVDIRTKIFSNAKEILVPLYLDNVFSGVVFNVPKKGDKYKLIELSYKNAKYHRLEKQKQLTKDNKFISEKRILTTIQKDLNLPVKPKRIECFDNSNLFGSEPVAACVVFKNGKPYAKEYRHYNIKTVIGANDFASMEEVVYRRYKRLLEERKDLPQLIVIDGGKGQLSAALRALERLNLRGVISMISIAKRLDEIYFPEDKVPVFINKNSETLKVIKHIRDEAHRFGITFHRNKRSQRMFTSELRKIKGIGDKTINKLLINYKSVENIKHATIESLEELVGKSKANLIHKFKI